MSAGIVIPVTASPELFDFIIGWEKCVLTPYHDGGGVLTCGVGHTGLDIVEGEEWTQERADNALKRDVRVRELILRPFLHRTPTQQQWDALVSLAFNCGSAAIGNSGLMARFNSNLDDECALRFLLWNKDNGEIIPGLTKRREAEMNIYLHGDYSGRP